MSITVKVDIWSDIACPFCYIGRHRFEEAAAASDVHVEVEYHSYELAPDTPDVVSATHAEHLSQKMGVTVDQAIAMEKRTIDAAAEVGLAIDYDRLRQSNTRRAHQLLHFARALGKQGAMKKRLMEAYFAEGRSMASIDDLTELAGEVGLDIDEVRRSLNENEYRDAVEADKLQAAEYGIRGVPFFVFDGALAVSGAQTVAVFGDAIRQAAAMSEDAA